MCCLHRFRLSKMAPETAIGSAVVDRLVSGTPPDPSTKRRREYSAATSVSAHSRDAPSLQAAPFWDSRLLRAAHRSSAGGRYPEGALSGEPRHLACDDAADLAQIGRAHV